METLYILIPVSVVLVFVIGILFWWSLRSGQFDDLEGPAYRMLMDDDHPESEGGVGATVAGNQQNEVIEKNSDAYRSK